MWSGGSLGGAERRWGEEGRRRGEKEKWRRGLRRGGGEEERGEEE